jgi:hypothetical protein
MTLRRGGRSPQVRPRPPSTGRPAPTKVRPRGPATSRISTSRRTARRSGLPLTARLILVLAVAILGVTVLYGATGGLGRAFTSVGATIGGFVEDLTATPRPRPTPIPVLEAPRIAPPPEPYTNLETVDLTVTVPREVIGLADARIRVYLALEGLNPAPLIDVPPAESSPQVVVPVELTPGSNTFTATIIRPGVESTPSAPVQFILDREPPAITLIRPAEGATVNAGAVELNGTTQPRSTLLVRNDTNGASLAGTAAADGTFVLTLPLADGPNALSIRATDPAGNVADSAVNVTRGTGKLTARLSLSAARIKVSSLPREVELATVVTNPDGQPLPNASVTFTLSVSGIRTVATQALTGANGRASFRTTIPAGALPGQGIATVFVVTEAFGNASGRALITILE